MFNHLIRQRQLLSGQIENSQAYQLQALSTKKIQTSDKTKWKMKAQDHALNKSKTKKEWKVTDQAV